MCAPALPLILGAVAAVGGTAYAMSQAKKANQQSPQVQQIDTSTPNIETYKPNTTTTYETAPEAPTAAPVMTTEGQGGADDEQAATDQAVKRNKKGRNALVIDRTQTTNTGLAGGSGVNVPGV